MNYLKIGKLLKEKREHKGLTYDQIFERTRIQPYILKDIEEGKFKQISEVSFKSFIKTYAKLLDVDLQKISPISKKEDSLEEEKTLKKKKKSTNFFLGLIFLFVLAILFFNHGFHLKKSLEEDISKTRSDLEGTSFKPESFFTSESKDSSKMSLENKVIESHLNRESENVLDKIRFSSFQHEILIRAFSPLKIYLKLDQQATVTKDLNPSKWFIIKAENSIYIRFDESTDQVEMFYNGSRWKFTSAPFFEKTFE
ncbi:MAG: helix-turn-helix domain-containing protein [Bdellovibrionales bacterium]|nr:helix-turn-helix domain-containing protein [Bdellovibrionales bacterium]